MVDVQVAEEEKAQSSGRVPQAEEEEEEKAGREELRA